MALMLLTTDVFQDVNIPTFADEENETQEDKNMFRNRVAKCRNKTVWIVFHMVMSFWILPRAI